MLGLQVYEFAPVTRIVAELPGQIVALDGVIVRGLPELVVIETFADDEHPFASVPMTVNVVLLLTVGV